MTKKILTKEYIKELLNPFIGEKLRVKFVDKQHLLIPFKPEIAMDSCFNIELDEWGIRYKINKNDVYNQLIKNALNGYLKEHNVYETKLDALLQQKSNTYGDSHFVSSVTEYLSNNLSFQIAITYYGQIQTLEVSEYGFRLNGVLFYYERYNF